MRKRQGESPLKKVPILGNLVQAGIGLVGRGKRKRELQRAEGAYDMQVQRFENIDTSNPYANQENVYDDATVNLQGADYAKQQAMQGQANMQDTFGQAAGGSGIASLAQVMSQQQGQQAQRSSVMIGEQEQKNQQQQMMEGARLQDQNIEGQMMSRQMESDKGQSLMSMAGQDLSKARMDKAMHDNMALAGVTGAVGGAMSKYAPMKA
jgi:hypothetical protein